MTVAVLFGLFVCSACSRPSAPDLKTRDDPFSAPQSPPRDSSVRITAIELDKLLPDCVNTPSGCLKLDDEYIAGVVQCEVAGITDAGAALEAQAIAARTYLASYYYRHPKGGKVDVTARFQCWRQPKTVRVLEAARATRGIIMLSGRSPLYSNYVAGTKHLSFDCKPSLPSVSDYAYQDWQSMRSEYRRRRANKERRRFKGTDWTELFVTRNEGREKGAIEPTVMSRPGTRNHGALSQRAAICLAENLGYETLQILKYFYGESFSLSAAIPDSMEMAPGDTKGRQ